MKLYIAKLIMKYRDKNLWQRINVIENHIQFKLDVTNNKGDNDET